MIQLENYGLINSYRRRFETVQEKFILIVNKKGKKGVIKKKSFRWMKST